MSIRFEVSLPATALKENYSIDVKKEGDNFVVHVASKDSHFRAVGTPFVNYMDSLEQGLKLIANHEKFQ